MLCVFLDVSCYAIDHNLTHANVSWCCLDAILSRVVRLPSLGAGLVVLVLDELEYVRTKFGSFHFSFQPSSTPSGLNGPI